MRVPRLAATVAAVTLFTAGTVLAAETTVIRITDKTLVEDTAPFGINLGGDAYYSGAALTRLRAHETFEGTTYRQCHYGPINDAHGATTWFRLNDQWKQMMLEGGRYTILSGPSRGTSGRIQGISTRMAEHQGKLEEFMYFEYDRQVTPDEPNMGLLIECDRTGDGQMHSLDGYWCSPHNRIATGDVHPGAFGCAALHLRGSQERAHYRFGTHYQRYGETNGTWHIRFWARAPSGRPQLTIAADPGEYGERAVLEPAGQWTQYDQVLEVTNVPEPQDPQDNPHLRFVFQAEGGDVLLDDVEIWLEGDTNPTAFRDDCVRMLETYRPGCIRNLQMGGSTLDNTLAPPLARHAFASQRSTKVGPYEGHSTHDYSLHEMYVLCEHVGADPWFCLPGTFSKDEMARFMEYLAAPADVGYGQRRAELGHPQPWTEVFERIHVEFGNEAWNNAGPYQCGGFNGRDYWQDLIAVGKASQHYRANILFHAAGQAANSWLNGTIMPRVPNADRFSVAPYIIQRISQADMAVLDTDAKLFRWAFAWPIFRSLDEDGAMRSNFELARQHDLELSIYEVNHHITHGDGPLEPRNKIVTSIGGGLNVCGNMLLMLKEHHLRTQALFSLVQHSYNAHGIGPVRLWGTALNMRSGHERYRPTFLACALANRVIGGRLVETEHADGEPTFTGHGSFPGRDGVEDYGPLPVLWSYAFRDGDRCGLIVLNLDVAEARPIALAFDGQVRGATARRWRLTAESVTADNEFEQPEPQVQLVEDVVGDFTPGYRFTAPPHSMLALEWQVE
jgi:hypothetical protein